MRRLEGAETTKVLHVITRLILGGAQQNTMITTSRLDPEKFAVTLVSGPQTGSEGEIIGEVRRRGVRLLILRDLVRELSPWRDLVVFVKLVRLMRGGAFSIVHTHSSKAGIIGRAAAKAAGVPVVVHTVHGWGFHDRMWAPRRWLFVGLERWAAALSDKLIVVASVLKETGLRHGIGREDQYVTIYSGIDLGEFDRPQFDTARTKKELGLPVLVLLLVVLRRAGWLKAARSASAQSLRTDVGFFFLSPLTEAAARVFTTADGLPDARATMIVEQPMPLDRS